MHHNNRLRKLWQFLLIDVEKDYLSNQWKQRGHTGSSFLALCCASVKTFSVSLNLCINTILETNTKSDMQVLSSESFAMKNT